MPANGRSVWCQWYSHFIALLPVRCECPKPPQALEQHCRGCGELNELSCEATLPPSAAQSMVTDFYPSRHHPRSWPVYSFSYLFIFWGRAQTISSYHYFTFLDIASWRILKGLLRELTRIAMLSLHQWNRFLLSPLWTLFPDITPGEAESVLLRSLCPCTGENAWLWAIVAQFSLFLWAKIFPEWRKRNKDDWRAGAESHQQPRWQLGDVRSRLMCGPVTADWQPRTGIQRRWNLPRTSDTLFMWCSQALPS